jgi:hypothetical protein
MVGAGVKDKCGTALVYRSMDLRQGKACNTIRAWISLLQESSQLFARTASSCLFFVLSIERLFVT